MSTRAATVLFAARHLESLYELRNHLEIAGVRVYKASSTREILDRLREEGPDLVVLDQDVDAATTPALILAIRTYTPSPDVILIADERPLETEAAQTSLGLLHLLPKPVDEGDLYEKILARVRERGLPRSLPQREAPLVLCVDDDALQLNALQRLLTGHGYRVYTCDTALRALASFPDLRPDVAIIDIMMPGTGGLDLTEKIRSRTGGKVPVVLLSALNTQTTRETARQRGASRYLVKPCPNKEVVAAVEAVLAEADR
jgi:DNA-binding response OmpR family regulator